MAAVPEADVEQSAQRGYGREPPRGTQSVPKRSETTCFRQAVRGAESQQQSHPTPLRHNRRQRPSNIWGVGNFGLNPRRCGVSVPHLVPKPSRLKFFSECCGGRAKAPSILWSQSTPTSPLEGASSEPQQRGATLWLRL
jgi:hypothetical protein